MKVETSSLVPAEPKKPCTKGEELFLVHLRRDAHMHDDPDDDLDVDKIPVHPQRKRSKSLGEELFEVHLKRSSGCDPDYDSPDEDLKHKNDKTAPGVNLVSPLPEKKDTSSVQA